MYDKYFHSKIIDKGIKSNEYTDLDWDSYIFRILNLTNKTRRLDVLPGLDKIYDLIFKGGNVKKLTSTEDFSMLLLMFTELFLKMLFHYHKLVMITKW